MRLELLGLLAPDDPAAARLRERLDDDLVDVHVQGPGQREYIRSMLRNAVYAAVE